MCKIVNNTFTSVCRCCKRIIKGSETKYVIEFQKYPVKWGYGVYHKEKSYILCKGCRRSLELFILKGGVLK